MAHLKLLGGATLVDDPGRPLAISARVHPLALLSLLVAAPSRTLSRGKLVGYLWPEVGEKVARNRLTSCVYQVRKELGDEVLTSVGDDLRLVLGDLRCDAVDFQRAHEASDDRRMIELYAGPFLDGFRIPRSHAFEEWADRQQRRFHRVYAEALEARAIRAAEEDRLVEAVRWWRRRSNADPLDSRVAAETMASLAAAGNRPEALRFAETFVRRVEEAVGMPPGPDFRRRVEEVRATPRPSVAVLPFTAVGGDEGEAFSDGIHRGILTRLSEFPGLRVIARTSVLGYRATAKPASEIGRELGVVWLVEGDVQESGGRLQVDARLVEAERDRQVWAERHEEVLSAENLFQLQADITKRIVGSLRIELSQRARTEVDRRPTESLEAYRLCAQGRMHLDRRSPDEMRRAVRCFESSIDHDPSYVLPWVGLGDALGLLHTYGHADAGEMLPRAEEAIRRALELDPDSAEAHAALGRLLGQRQRALEADAELGRATELNPGYADAHSWSSVGSQVLGRPAAALASARRAVELNPLSPEAVANLAMSHLINGHYDEALTEARRILQLVPSYATGSFYEGLVHHETGRFVEAAAALRGVEVPWAGSAPRATRALALLRLGEPEAARARLEQIEAAGHMFDAGLVRAGFGEAERALDAMLGEIFTSVDHHVNYWPTVAFRYLFGGIWDGLRVEPRYQELVRRVEEAWRAAPSDPLD